MNVIMTQLRCKQSAEVASVFGPPCRPMNIK